MSVIGTKTYSYRKKGLLRLFFRNPGKHSGNKRGCCSLQQPLLYIVIRARRTRQVYSAAGALESCSCSTPSVVNQPATVG